MRQLTFPERKLLKKVDFLQWRREHNLRELQVNACLCIFTRASEDTLSLQLRPICVPTTQVMRRYHIQDRDDYKKYNKLCGLITKFVNVIKRLDSRDPARIELTDQLLDK